MLNQIKSKFQTKVKRGQLVLKTCPYCGNNNWNLEISIDKKIFHCWVCDSSGVLAQFCRDNDIPYVVSEFVEREKKPERKIVEDPLQIIVEKNSVLAEYGNYKKLFTSKGIDEEDIITYNIRRSLYRRYLDKLLIPLFEGKSLVYLVFRGPLIKDRYYNIGSNRMDILPYYLGWKDKYVLHICEGVFDAISIHKLGYSSAVLLGTTITPKQISKLKSFGFECAVVCLDGDARKNAIILCDTLVRSNVPSKIVWFQSGDEPNDMYVRNRIELYNTLQEPKEILLKDRVCV